MSIRCAIVGPTGYTGLYLIQLLARHPEAEVTYLASHRQQLPDITEEFPQLLGVLPREIARCQPINAEAIAREADVAFLALPHRAAMAYTPRLLDAGVRVIDLSADYRLKDPLLYEKTYEQPHTDTVNLKEAVYGLPEIYRRQLAGAMLVANPGCYPTAAALGIGPLLVSNLVCIDHILINAASGVTGAGRKPSANLHFAEANEGYTAYGRIGGHRHQPEIEQTLTAISGKQVRCLFVPHLLPIDQGILETIYLDPTEDNITEQEVMDAFILAYAEEPFIRVKETLPNVKHVRDTNFCDVSVKLAKVGDDTKVIVFSAIDNMIKGASGQAIQNMNLVFELEETMGLV